MKNAFKLLICLIAPVFTNSQTYEQLRDSSAKLRQKKDYGNAFILLTQGMEKAHGHPYHNDLYDAAALASLSGQKDTAFYYLNVLIREGEFEMVTCSAVADEDFKNLHADTRWGQINGKAFFAKIDNNLKTLSAVAECIATQDKLKAYTDSCFNELIEKNLLPKMLYRQLQQYNHFPKLHFFVNRQLLEFGIRLNDSIYSFYEVQLPDNYDPKKSYSLLLVLHGAVSMNLSFPDPLTSKKYGFMDTTGMNQFFSSLGYATNTIVVFPHGNRTFNWMYPDYGFSMVPDIVSDCKRYFNIDDNRVFVSGHSNGATGVISYLLKDPSLFAGFYGFNSNPRIRTGGTFLKNAINRSYFNVSTDKDYYFPLEGHDSITSLAHSLHIDWQNHVYIGYPHWFPQFKESKPAFELMFKDMEIRKRNPFKKEIYWECDDISHGKCDWIGIDELDTNSIAKPWHSQVNFTTSHWLDNNDFNKVHDTLVTAFNFPRKSGAVKAEFSNNIFLIQTSRVKKITLFISPEMINMDKPIQVWLNEKKILIKKIPYNKNYIINNFHKSFDRKKIWVNELTINVPK